MEYDMPKSYLQLRDGHYHYVRRVPADLVVHFPSPVISRSLHTNDKKYATILASAWGYKTHQIFLQLRSGMLDQHLMEHLIARYLNSGLQVLESMAYGRRYERGEMLTTVGLREEFAPYVVGRDEIAREQADEMQQALMHKDIDAADHILQRVLLPFLKKEHKIKRLGSHEHLELSMRILQAERQLILAESGVLEGRHEVLDLIRDKVKHGLARPYLPLDKVLERFKEKYTDGKRMEKRAEQQLDTDLEVIQEIFGNVSLDFVNSREGIIKCKNILKKYPLNRVQRFGKRPNQKAKPSEKVRVLDDIIKKEKGYEVIKPQTANAYIKRLKAIIDYANKHEDFEQINRWDDELFHVGPEDENPREAYEQDDIDRLITAICTQKLWIKGDPRPERFWQIGRAHV